ncbi:MAG TPA: hypothetical protein PLU13_01255 [Thermomonas sp.]|uniref:COG3650 family protein n=1 Tax=Thermomonas sp. TaxID=1971895 RepID=UPI001EB602C5|nr:hypothetical protein [Thermomonas sp.]MBK6416427.1 hypothetical protein [Thermomonas sp.]MBK7205706.1 hypothetical protein [Thermomonas sp.]HQW58804.1 hypothetical protein [Thermomonas sp.]
MKLAIASLSLLLVACTAPQPPAAPEPPPAPEPVVAPATPAGEAAMGKRAPGQENVDPLQVFRAFGTEPFWNVNVEDAVLTYSTPGDQQGVAMQGTRRALADGVEINGSHDGRVFTLTVTAGTCSDGMSDNTYTMVSTFRYGDLDLKGCGEAAK